MDPRKILGVDANASPEEIQRAYRDKAKKHHPDMGGDSWAFQQVQDAYQALTQPNSTRSSRPKTGPQSAQPNNTPHSRQSSSPKHASNGDQPRRNDSNPDAQRPRSKRPAAAQARRQAAPSYPPHPGWRNLLTGQLPLQTATTVFILVNCLDIFMTYALLSSTRGAVESNPIAAYFMYRWGFRGAIAFKLAIVAFVTVIAQIVAIKKIRAAQFLLWSGTILVSLVVIYSVMLFLKHSP